MKRPDRLLRLHLALGLLSVAVIALQLVLMQVLAITQWHHFAYMVISVALLGFGAAGTLIALFRVWLIQRLDHLLPLLLLTAAAAMAAVVTASQGLFGGFDSYLLFFDPGHIWRLLLAILLFAIPFFLSALVIGLIFVRHAERIGSLYFANLLGSGLGGLVGMTGLGLFFPERLPSVIALFTLTAGLLLWPRARRGPVAAAAIASVVIVFSYVRPAPLVLSQYKDLRGALDLPQAGIVAARPSPDGLVQAVSAPALRVAPGLSLNYSGPVPVRDHVFNNGNSFGAVPGWPPESPDTDDYTTAALPYALGEPRSVLVLHAGTGTAAVLALARGAERVTLVEPHREVPALLQQTYPDTAGRLLRHPAVSLVPLEPRAFLETDPGRHELIVLPTVGAFGGSAGLFALQEQHSLTTEGVSALWQHLTPDGILCLTAWLDYPPRNPLRLAATLVTALETLGIDAPEQHLAAVRSWGTVTFCLKRSPLNSADLQQVRRFCRQMHFDPLLLPDLQPDEREHFHRLQDRRFFADLDRLFSAEREQLYADHLFRLHPTTDNRPFFSQFLRWQSLPHLARLMGERSVPFLEMGYLIVVLTFGLLTGAAVVLIVLPLFRLGWTGQGRLRTLLYFGGLGIGYMLVEIDLIHRFVLYLGHPLRAAATVICALLVFSGLGSHASSRLTLMAATPRLAAGAVTMLLLLYALALPALIDLTITLPLAWKMSLTPLLLAPPAIAMGLPFPLGLRQLSRSSEADLPWAWGINGCFSVLSTALATIIAVEAGFTMVFLLAAAAYGVAALSGIRG